MQELPVIVPRFLAAIIETGEHLRHRAVEPDLDNLALVIGKECHIKRVGQQVLAEGAEEVLVAHSGAIGHRDANLIVVRRRAALAVVEIAMGRHEIRGPRRQRKILIGHRVAPIHGNREAIRRIWIGNGPGQRGNAIFGQDRRDRQVRQRRREIGCRNEG
jgi:hypothetical protein